MKVGNDVVVQDWNNLSQIPKDKLIKLRDVSQDNLVEAFKEYQELSDNYRKICLELSNRKN